MLLVHQRDIRQETKEKKKKKKTKKNQNQKSKKTGRNVINQDKNNNSFIYFYHRKTKEKMQGNLSNIRLVIFPQIVLGITN